MHELLNAAISAPNIILTTLLVFVLCYWLLVFLGAFDVSAFDIDLDIDADVDIDADIDVDADVDGLGGLAGALHFFNFGRIPFMIVFSFLILSMWTLSILYNHYFGGGSLLFATAFFLPNMFVSLMITKIITTPLIPVFESLNEGQAPVDYIGEVAKMLLPATTNQTGQAEVTFEDNPLLISVRVTENFPTPVLRGEEVVIVGRSSDERFYLVRKLEE